MKKIGKLLLVVHFFFQKQMQKRELGLRRTKVSKDMTLICREYGISMYLLVKRAALCGIITSSVEKDFYIKAGKAGLEKGMNLFGVKLKYRLYLSCLYLEQ